MPPRPQTIDKKALQGLFDLPISARIGLQYIVPPRENHQNSQNKPPGKQRRARWEPAHVQYLEELMELATWTLNRLLESKDFPAITEALHRKFRGGSAPGNPYPDRGYNTIRSSGTKSRAYDTSLRRLIPDHDLVKARKPWAPVDKRRDRQ